MKIKKPGRTSTPGTCLITPVLAQAENFEHALKAAYASIDNAKAANYEWRDSRKLLKQAAELNKAGTTGQAMALVTKAKQQGELAVAQAEQQSAVTGPR